MHIILISVGQKMPRWVEDGFLEYSNRLSQDITLSLKEIPLTNRKDKNQIAQAIKKESEQIQEIAKTCDYIITLDGKGKEYSSEDLAKRLSFWQNQARTLALIIGGPEGLSPEVKAMAHESWSLGKLTLPHPLVRIVVAEALYRAWSINCNHPYHRA